MSRARIGRSAVAVICALGFACIPAHAANLSLSTGNLSTYRSCTLTVRGNAATEGFDSWVNQASTGQNNGTATTMNVTSNGTSNRRSYVFFDLTKCSPAIPASATVTSATIRLFVSAVPAACRTQDIFRATAAWTEAGITWANQPTVAASRTSSMNVGPSGCQNATTNVYVTGWDVTADVTAFRSGTTNRGWMIRDDVEGSGSSQASTYATRDANNATQSPQLIVNYM